MNLRLIPLGLLLASTPLLAEPAKPTPAGWQTYTDIGGAYKIDYPPTWQVLSKGNALIITSPGGPEERGVFGITPRAEGTTLHESVDKEFADRDHPADLQKSPTRLAGALGVKVWGSKKGDPKIRVVEYYVQQGSQPYYILFQAPHVSTAEYGPIFNTMIGSLQFLK